ncbi:hypothetical protein EMWEY_00015350, partial [Eimeria maxima]
PKLFKQAAPNQETLPEPPSLDPDVELLIDSFLSENENILHEDAWIVDDDIGNSNSATHSEDAASLQESVEPMSQPTVMETNQVAPLLSGALLAPGGAELTGTTPLSLFESVLSESSHTAQAVSLEEWLSGEEAADLVEALQPMPSPGAFPPVPSSIEPAEEATKSHAGLSGTMSEGTMHSGPLSSSEPLQSDSPRERSGEEWLRIPTAGFSMLSEQGLAPPILGPHHLRNALPSTTSTSDTRILSQASNMLGLSVARNVLSFTTFTRDPHILAPGGSIQASESARQSLSHRAQLAIDDLFSSLGWLDKMLRGVPDQVLATHPFYRIPGVKQSFRRCFCKENAVSSSLSHVSLVPLLSECRLLLKKPVLSNEETEALLGYMERLCGYASRLLPTRAPPTLKVFSVEVLGKAFVVLDTLHCAAEVLGQSSKKEQWWPDIVSHIENARDESLASHSLQPEEPHLRS